MFLQQPVCLPYCLTGGRKMLGQDEWTKHRAEMDP